MVFVRYLTYVPADTAMRLQQLCRDSKLYVVIEDGRTNNGWLYCTTNQVQ
jgi:hypothetical protein